MIDRFLWNPPAQTFEGNQHVYVESSNQEMKIPKGDFKHLV